MECPCRKCISRHATCHGLCNAYAAWKAEDLKRAERERQERYIAYLGMREPKKSRR